MIVKRNNKYNGREPRSKPGTLARLLSEVFHVFPKKSGKNKSINMQPHEMGNFMESPSKFNLYFLTVC
jgi:hypothetical protein